MLTENCSAYRVDSTLWSNREKARPPCANYLHHFIIVLAPESNAGTVANRRLDAAFFAFLKQRVLRSLETI